MASVAARALALVACLVGTTGACALRASSTASPVSAPAGLSSVCALVFLLLLYMYAFVFRPCGSFLGVSPPEMAVR